MSCIHRCIDSRRCLGGMESSFSPSIYPLHHCTLHQGSSRRKSLWHILQPVVRVLYYCCIFGTTSGRQSAREHGYMRPHGIKELGVTQIIKCKTCFDLKTHSHHAVDIFFSYAEYPTCPFLSLRTFPSDHSCLLRASSYTLVSLGERR